MYDKIEDFRLIDKIDLFGQNSDTMIVIKIKLEYN